MESEFQEKFRIKKIQSEKFCVKKSCYLGHKFPLGHSSRNYRLFIANVSTS